MILPISLLFLAIVAAGEIARRISLLPRFTALAGIGRRAGAVLRRRGVSDHAKERATRILALRMMAASLGAGLALALAIAPVIGLLLADGPLPLGVENAFFDWQARLLLLTLSLTYAFARWRWRHRRLQSR